MRRRMGKLFKYLNSLPWTKPLAIIVALMNIIIFALSFFLNRDYPPTAAQVWQWFSGVVWAASVAKSGWEGKKGGEPHGEQQ